MTVWFEAAGRVATITLARPQVRNAVDLATARAIAAALDELDARDDVTAGVLAGEGPVFCAGMDLKAFAATGERPVVAGRGAVGPGQPRRLGRAGGRGGTRAGRADRGERAARRTHCQVHRRRRRTVARRRGVRPPGAVRRRLPRLGGRRRGRARLPGEAPAGVDRHVTTTMRSTP